MKMVTVPAGTTVIGTSDQQIDRLISQTDWAAMWMKKGFFKREQPQHEVHVDTFSIGIHSVTVGQYQAFINAGGYAIGRYWAENGRLWREMNGVNKPAFWDDELWTGDPHLPVVGVNWYEAAAFCRWMTESLGEVCRLPTEVEWEKAAGGGDGRLYPWGDLFDPRKCNTRAAGINHTLPVGSYNPAGDSPFGCREMIGNVSEWTLSKFAPYPYVPDDGREELEGQAERITRGGSWHSPDFRSRISARGMNDPSFRDNDLGFRIVSNITGCG